MGLNRRLQTEIDRCMKRVSDGQHDFQELWLKLEAMEMVSPRFINAFRADSFWCMFATTCLSTSAHKMHGCVIVIKMTTQHQRYLEFLLPEVLCTGAQACKAGRACAAVFACLQ